MKRYNCRMWTRKHGEWVCVTEHFNTAEAAVERGEKHKRLMRFDDIERVYEIIEEGTDMEYLYGMRLRGFGIACQPMDGFVDRRDGFDRYWDVLVYNRKLSKKELVDYELDYLGCSSHPIHFT